MGLEPSLAIRQSDKYSPSFYDSRTFRGKFSRSKMSALTSPRNSTRNSPPRARCQLVPPVTRQKRAATVRLHEFPPGNEMKEVWGEVAEWLKALVC